jgi:hypothetical protein
MPILGPGTKTRRQKGVGDPGYRESRTTVVVGARESKKVRIQCAFEPQRVMVDPDGYAMQFQKGGIGEAAGRL